MVGIAPSPSRFTALALGLPARLVRNEAHAWVEVGDGAIWHRIDLGGAAGRFELDPSARTPPHVPPEDPFVWPAGAQSSALAVASSGAAPSPGASGTASSAPFPGAADRSEEPELTSSVTPRASSMRRVASRRPSVEVEVASGEARRGARVHVHGGVTTEGEACRPRVVDFALRASNGHSFTLGSLPTDDKGRFDAELTVPLGLDVGDYALAVTTPGAGRCGASR